MIKTPSPIGHKTMEGRGSQKKQLFLRPGPDNPRNNRLNLRLSGAWLRGSLSALLERDPPWRAVCSSSDGVGALLQQPGKCVETPVSQEESAPAQMGDFPVNYLRQKLSGTGCCDSRRKALGEATDLPSWEAFEKFFPGIFEKCLPLIIFPFFDLAAGAAKASLRLKVRSKCVVSVLSA
ncbi:hypothetical protein NPIL_437551 [Nephila pilipes]|uniref:Uncharacterized protein n=1 Tax=Nephila pilipes TaxID=299642 RepID=A0A8X6MDP1_NEPPI|nr:hypothetical protein NPIL_437551 [Nephila pilipes]